MPVFKQRRGTSAALAAANETPAAGQIIYETDTNRIKVGNGYSPYNSLPYLVAPTAVADVVGLQAALTAAQAAAVSTALATVTKANVGLGNASNTSDADKPVSTAQAAANSAVQSTAASDATTKANAAQAFAIQRANHTGTQAISTVVGLQTALDGKQAAGSYAASAHTHGISDTTGLQTALDGKAAASHTHTIANVTGLQTALDGKQAAGSYAAAVHTHAVADVTGLQTALDGKAAGSHTHLASAITDFTSAVVAVAPPTTNANLLTSGTLADARLSANVVFTSDARLTDSRTPTAHNHSATEITSGTLSDSQLSANVVFTTDARLNDEIVEYALPANFPATGVSSILYVATDTSRAYRWTGAVYVEVGSASLGFVTSVAGKLGDVTLDHRDIGNLPATLTQFTADQNNLSLGTGGIIRISSDAARNITGFAGGQSGDARMLVNVGSFAITLKNQSTASNAANRIIGSGSADVSIPSQGSVVVYYDGTDSRWRAG